MSIVLLAAFFGSCDCIVVGPLWFYFILFITQHVQHKVWYALSNARLQA